MDKALSYSSRKGKDPSSSPDGPIMAPSCPGSKHKVMPWRISLVWPFARVVYPRSSQAMCMGKTCFFMGLQTHNIIGHRLGPLGPQWGSPSEWNNKLTCQLCIHYGHHRQAGRPVEHWLTSQSDSHLPSGPPVSLVLPLRPILHGTKPTYRNH